MMENELMWSKKKVCECCSFSLAVIVKEDVAFSKQLFL